MTLLPFLLTVLTVTAGLHFYLYRRFVHDLTTRPGLRRLGAASAVLLGLLFVAGPVTLRLEPTGALLLLSRTSYVWWALTVYAFFSLVVVDLVRFLGGKARRATGQPSSVPPPAAEPAVEEAPSPTRREFLVHSATFGAAALATSATGYGFWRAWGPAEISEVGVKLAGLPRALSGLTLAHLTDIHVGGWVDERFLRQLVEQTNDLKPDAVVITGDLVDGSVEHLMPMVGLLGSLRSRYGTYFVTGNHEYYSGADAWCDALDKLGITSLRNRRVSLGDPGPGGASLDLVGVDDRSAGSRGFPGRSDLAGALSGRDPTRPAVLLAHQPHSRDVTQAAAAGVGLQLSGHTHGGQMWPWSFAVRAAFPYFAGLYTVQGMALYVSRGCGFWGPPVRVGAAPEIVKVVLG